MNDLGKFFARFGADAMAGTVVSDKIGKARLDRRVALAQLVIGRIRNRRRVVQIVAPVVRCQLVCQPFELVRSFGARQLLDWLLGSSHARLRSFRAGVWASTRRRRAAARASSVTVVPDS